MGINYNDEVAADLYLCTLIYLRTRKTSYLNYLAGGKAIYAEWFSKRHTNVPREYKDYPSRWPTGGCYSCLQPTGSFGLSSHCPNCKSCFNYEYEFGAIAREIKVSSLHLEAITCEIINDGHFTSRDTSETKATILQQQSILAQLSSAFSVGQTQGEDSLRL